MTTRKRLARLEAANPPPAVPMLLVGIYGSCYCAGKETTREAWLAEYGERIEEERRRTGRRFFGVDFTPPEPV